MRVLIFGGTGFCGAHLAELSLSAGDEVFVTGRARCAAPVRKDPPKRAPGARFLSCDTTHRDEVEAAFSVARPERVYQLAGLASVAKSFEGEQEVYQTNVLGTLAVLQAARSLAPTARVLVVGSSEEYGRITPEELPISEETPLRPLSPYGVSRAAASLMALREARAGLHVVVARAFNLIGPGQSRAFACADFAAQIAAGLVAGARRLTLITGNLEARRDFSSVLDGVRAYRHILEEGRPGEAYNVCSGEARSVRALLEDLARLAGITLETRTDPARLRPSEVPEIRGDPKKLLAETRFEPQPHALEKVLEQLLAEAITHAHQTDSPTKNN